MKKPRYLAVSLQSIEILSDFGNDSDKVLFIDWLRETFKKIHAGENPYSLECESKALRRATEEAITVLTDGYEIYMKRASGNKNKEPEKGIPTNGQPMVPHCNSSDISVVDNQSDHTNETEKRKEQINQIKRELKPAGYTEAEVDMAAQRIDSHLGITNLTGYYRTCIDREREKNVKRVPAQRYTQRSYDNEQDEAMRRMIESAKERGIIEHETRAATSESS